MLTDVTTLYRENNDHKDFKFMHCFMKLQNNKKWESTRIDLNGGHGAQGPNDPAFPASEGRPVGHKKAKSD